MCCVLPISFLLMMNELAAIYHFLQINHCIHSVKIAWFHLSSLFIYFEYRTRKRLTFLLDGHSENVIKSQISRCQNKIHKIRISYSINTTAAAHICIPICIFLMSDAILVFGANILQFNAHKCGFIQDKYHIHCF